MIRTPVADECGDERRQQQEKEAENDRGRNSGECGFDKEQHKPEKRDAKIDDNEALGVVVHDRISGCVSYCGSPEWGGLQLTLIVTGLRDGAPTMTTVTIEDDLKAAIRSIPDYPKPGIMFRDITTLLGDARAFRRAVDALVHPWAGGKVDKVAGIEARGFILGGAVAHQVSAGFVPIRKKGKLPFKRVSIGYSLEYGIDEMEMHEDAVLEGERVILVDDLVATGGTAEAACKLLKQMGADVFAACFIIDLPELGGAAKIKKLGVPVRTLVSFEGH